jgi:hypothetical protein
MCGGAHLMMFLFRKIDLKKLKCEKREEKMMKNYIGGTKSKLELVKLKLFIGIKKKLKLKKNRFVSEMKKHKKNFSN